MFLLIKLILKLDPYYKILIVAIIFYKKAI